MTEKMSYIGPEAVLLTILLVFLPIVSLEPIPAEKSQLDRWFSRNVGSFTLRKGSLCPDLEAAEANPTVITVRADGGGDFRTVTHAIEGIPDGNENRVIVYIGPGTYAEKVKIDMYKPFITLYGDPNDMPTLVFGGTAAQFGTVDSATLIVESDYFSAVNLVVKNSAPRPDGHTANAQAAAMRVSGDYASFYNCEFYGFQDTLVDDKGKHFFKDCYVEGTVDFLCGSGQSIYLNSVIHVIPGDGLNFITAHARTGPDEPSGYSIVHSAVTGSGETAYLGRPWFNYSRVVYSYSELSDVVTPYGWTYSNNLEYESTVYFGEYQNEGPGSDLRKRPRFAKKLSDAEAQPFISLDFIEASKWLLPPPTFLF